MAEPGRLVDNYEISAEGYPGTYSVNVRKNRTLDDFKEQVRRLQMEYPSMTKERHARFVSAVNRMRVVLDASRRQIGASGNYFRVRKNNNRS